MLSSTPRPCAAVKAVRPRGERCAVVCAASAEQPSRRSALSLAAASAAALLARPALAAYGEAANVFGGATNASGYVPFAGDGYALLLPSKYNPSKEREFPGTDIRYEDNFDAVNFLAVLVTPTSKAKIEDYGTPDQFVKELQPLLGKQAWFGRTDSEGGFASGKVSVANLLTADSVKKGDKTYYRAEILTRTADGDEGGRHHLFDATVSNGKLYILNHQVGDKRWFKGLEASAKTVAQSFTVA